MPSSTGSERVAIVDVNGLRKTFPARKSWVEILRHPLTLEKVTVLEDVTLRIDEGEFFGLLGQNGAGKTTLFRILSTLVLPDGGSVSVGGLDALKHDREVRALIAPVIANERSLNWRLDARENLRLYAALQQIPQRMFSTEVERVLQIVAMGDTGNKMVGTFSSGMRQRLLIARALLGRPRVLLLDEPTKSLDPISARDFRNFLRTTIVGEQGCTVMLATHDADDVWNLCDRVAVLHKGKLLAVDNTTNLRNKVGDDLHRVWVRDDQMQLLAEVSKRMGVEVVRAVPATEQGWTEASAKTGKSGSAAADFLAAVVLAGVSVARFEKTAPDLADLIERVVESNAGRED